MCRGRVFNQIAQTVDLRVFLGRLRGYIFKEQQFRLPQFVALGLSVLVVVLLEAFGHLCILLLDFVNFGDIDECDVFLPVDFFQLETLVNRCIADSVDFLLDEWELDCQLLGSGLLHYLYNYFQNNQKI